MKRKLQKIGYFCLISSMIVFIGFFVIMFVHRRDIVRRNSFDNLQQKAACHRYPYSCNQKEYKPHRQKQE